MNLISKVTDSLSSAFEIGGNQITECNLKETMIKRGGQIDKSACSFLIPSTYISILALTSLFFTLSLSEFFVSGYSGVSESFCETLGW